MPAQDSDAVLENAVSHTVTHNLADAATGVFATPNWWTQIRFGTKAANTVVLEFSNPAPASAEIDWRAYET